jgi:hypothetical protein
MLLGVGRCRFAAVGRNGKRAQRRPRVELITPAPSPQEAEAIAAAIERFVAETAPAPAISSPQSRWQRAALHEGVGAKQALASPWGAL